MSWLAPLFLLGLAGIALPLWLHRLQTRNPERVAFSSVMLLSESERRLRVQKRLRFLLLLALRITLLALLALAFAQPVWQKAVSLLGGGDARLHLFIVDTSLSMSATGRMEAARVRLLQLIDAMGANDRAIMVSASDTLQLLAVPGARIGEGSADRAALRSVANELQAGSGRLEYALAVGALDQLAGESRLPVAAHLLSDFQASGLGTRFTDLVPRSESSRALQLTLHPLEVRTDANWRIEGVREQRGAVAVRAQALGAGGSRTIDVAVNERVRGTLRLQLAAGGSGAVQQGNLALSEGANRVVASLNPGDALASDDRYFAVVEGGGTRSVPLLTADPRGASARYLEAALAVGGTRFATAPIKASAFDARSLDRHPWVIVDDLGVLDAPLASALAAYVERGGAVLAAASAQSATRGRLPLLDLVVEGVTVRAADPLSVGRIDATHELLVDSGGWQNLAVARMLRVQPGAQDRVLLNTDDGAALLVERKIGAGRILWLSTGLDNVWSDLTVQPVFVSFMAQAAAWLAGQGAYTAQQTVGSVLQLAQAGTAAGQVIGPDGANLLSLSETQRARSLRLERPGFYEIVTPARSALLAVNVDARESELRPMDSADIKSWQQAASASQAVAAERERAQAQQSMTPLAPLLLLLLAAAVVLESLTGNWTLALGRKARA